MRYEVKEIPGGFAGTDATVETMAQLIQDSLTDPVVVQTARNIVRSVEERDKDAEALAVREWILAHFRYVNEGVETISTPRVMLDEIRKYGAFSGDCDDVVVLGGALQRALGHEVRIRVISQRPDKYFSHVFYEYLSPKKGWVGQDLIMRKKPFGWEPTVFTNEKTYDSLGCCGMGDNMDSLFSQMIPANPFSTNPASNPFVAARTAFQADEQAAQNNFPAATVSQNQQMNSFALPSDQSFVSAAAPLMQTQAGAQTYTSNWFGTGQSGETWASLLSGSDVFYEKTGGHLTYSDTSGRLSGIGSREDEQMGQIIEAATAIVPGIMKIFKKAKSVKGGKGGGAAPPPSCPPGTHTVAGLGGLGLQCVKDTTAEDYLVYAVGGAAVLGALWYVFLRKKR